LASSTPDFGIIIDFNKPTEKIAIKKFKNINLRRKNKWEK